MNVKCVYIGVIRAVDILEVQKTLRKNVCSVQDHTGTAGPTPSRSRSVFKNHPILCPVVQKHRAPAVLLFFFLNSWQFFSSFPRQQQKKEEEYRNTVGADDVAKTSLLATREEKIKKTQTRRQRKKEKKNTHELSQ